MSNELQEIIFYIDGADKNLWSAAEKLAEQVGTAGDRRPGIVSELRAMKPELSSDKIYRLATAGRFYRIVIEQSENDAVLIRHLYTGHASLIGSRYFGGEMALDTAVEWAKIAHKHEYSIEKLRSVLPNSGTFNTGGGFPFRAKKAITVLRGLVENETLGADPKYIRNIIRVGKIMVTLLERATDDKTDDKTDDNHR